MTSDQSSGDERADVCGGWPRTFCNVSAPVHSEGLRLSSTRHTGRVTAHRVHSGAVVAGGLGSSICSSVEAVESPLGPLPPVTRAGTAIGAGIPMRVVYTVLSNNRHGQDMDMLDVEKFGAGGLR